MSYTSAEVHKNREINYYFLCSLCYLLSYVYCENNILIAVIVRGAGKEQNILCKHQLFV